MDLRDDQDMMRYFRRKINNIGERLYEVEELLKKDPGYLNSQDQKTLRNLWNDFKKVITLIALSIRIKTGNSHFSLSDKDLIEEFQNSFPHQRDYT